MNSKERVKLAFSHRIPDRVPIDYTANPGIDQRLKEHFGLNIDDHEGLLKALGVDFRMVSAPYTGLQLFDPVPGREVDIWGIHRRWVEHGTGGYWDYCDFPLRDATLEQVEAWPLPALDDFDYPQVGVQCQAWDGYYLIAGNAGIGDIINSTGMLRNMEQVMIDLITDDPAFLRYVERKNTLVLESLRRTIEAGNGAVDMLYIGEDLGTQLGPMISLKTFRKHIRPVMQKYVDLGKSFGIPVMLHSCGSSSWVFEDILEMGITVVDTLQPEAVNMAPAYLKQRFGDRLSFHGCITTGGPVAFGTVQETVDMVKDTLAVMMPGGGYAFCPSHALQDNSPTENVVAMYAAALQYGTYR